MFEQKRAVIVGGASGIGLETVQRLAQAGAHVCIIDRDTAKLDHAIQAISAIASRTEQIYIGHAADASNGKQMQHVFAKIEQQWVHLDIHVHVAGISGRSWGDGPIDECTEEGWDIVMQNNIRSVYLSNKMATQIMKRQRAGSIINVSSILGLVGAQEHFVTHAYAASRGAVISLSRAMAAYYAKFGIRINCVCPGLLDTPMSQRAVQDMAIRDALTSLQPLAPHIGYPEDVAEAILYLASDAAKWVTGIVLPIDGGWSAH